MKPYIIYCTDNKRLRVEWAESPPRPPGTCLPVLQMGDTPSNNLEANHSPYLTSDEMRLLKEDEGVQRLVDKMMQASASRFGTLR